MFKRILLAAVAFSVLAAPMAQAQSRYDTPRSGTHRVEKLHKPDQVQKQRHVAPRKQQAQRFAPPSRHHWKKGERVRDWRQRPHVRDYSRYGLRKPAQGQQWVRVDNDYLLVSMATGLILGLAASR